MARREREAAFKLGESRNKDDKESPAVCEASKEEGGGARAGAAVVVARVPEGTRKKKIAAP
jgi:hypothetical protein